ncbi:hypothetical protein SEA_ENGINEER_183 [Gordonia Phage Engineer]|nr:hypothetical protein SEA_ENGINEER_183 [Gordonia Phage Engineer]
MSYVYSARGFAVHHDGSLVENFSVSGNSFTQIDQTCVVWMGDGARNLLLHDDGNLDPNDRWKLVVRVSMHEGRITGIWVAGDTTTVEATDDALMSIWLSNAQTEYTHLGIGILAW